MPAIVAGGGLMKMKNSILSFCVTLLFTLPLFAQQEPSAPGTNDQNAAMEQKIRDLEDRIISLEGQVRTLKSNAAAPVPEAATAKPAPSTQTQAQAEAIAQAAAVQPT